ncbi:MAG TPA: DUF721 domain-containing protein [Candidatus Sulfotelmatobacter sp.]|nr:DUF721 domain-containing protein [Candidatus Sulfotelmatobacter sp.]
MERAGELLGRALRRIERSEAALAWLTSAWPAIVGRPLAAHTHPVRCEGGTLAIAADTAPWQNQIEGMQREFRTRVNQAWGGALVREVKVLAGRPGPGPSREFDNAHTPFLRRRR